MPKCLIALKQRENALWKRRAAEIDALAERARKARCEHELRAATDAAREVRLQRAIREAFAIIGVAV